MTATSKFDGVETSALLCCNGNMEDYKPFKIVSVLQGAKTHNIDSVYDAAKYLLEKWPDEEHGPKYMICREILLKCLEGGCSTAIARVAFVEAAREAGIYVDTTPRPPPTGKLQRWGKKRTLARDRRPRQ